jgi:hypothetical protein
VALSVIELKRKDVMKRFNVTVRVTGFRGMTVRTKVSVWCFRLGAWLLGSPVNVEFVLPLDGRAIAKAMVEHLPQALTAAEMDRRARAQGVCDA